MNLSTELRLELSDLIPLNTVDEGLAGFLSACIRARKSIVVAGGAGSGKTTLTRAMLNALPPKVPIATIEHRYELGLHLTPDRHQRVLASAVTQRAEAGHPGATHDGSSSAMADLFTNALRRNVEHLAVGEIRGSGEEILGMLASMRAGRGTIATVHAAGCRAAVRRLATSAARTGAVTTGFAYRQIAELVDLVVHVQSTEERHGGHRFICEIHELSHDPHAPYGVIHNVIYEPGPDGRATPTGALPTWVDELTTYGFDPTRLRKGHGMGGSG